MTVKCVLYGIKGNRITETTVDSNSCLGKYFCSIGDGPFPASRFSAFVVADDFASAIYTVLPAPEEEAA